MKADNLTVKQRKWLQAYIKTGNATEAARQAYDCTKKSAKQIGYENLRKLTVSVKEIMDRQGITDVKLLAILNEGLKAERTEFAKFQGEIVDRENVIDHQTRHKYLEIALKLKGLLRDRIDVTHREFQAYDGKPENAEEYVREYISSQSGDGKL